MGIDSLDCGIIAICTLGYFLIPEVLGIVFGIIAIRDKTGKNGLPIAGNAIEKSNDHREE